MFVISSRSSALPVEPMSVHTFLDSSIRKGKRTPTHRNVSLVKSARNFPSLFTYFERYIIKVSYYTTALYPARKFWRHRGNRENKLRPYRLRKRSTQVAWTIDSGPLQGDRVRRSKRGQTTWEVAESLQQPRFSQSHKISVVAQMLWISHCLLYWTTRRRRTVRVLRHHFKGHGFDPLIQHLRSKKILADRGRTVADIPVVRSSNSKSPQERIAIILGKLQRLKAAKPRTIKTLSSTIGSLFQNQLSEAQVEVLVQSLAKQRYLEVTGAKITYALPSDSLTKRSQRS